MIVRKGSKGRNANQTDQYSLRDYTIISHSVTPVQWWSFTKKGGAAVVEKPHAGAFPLLTGLSFSFISIAFVATWPYVVILKVPLCAKTVWLSWGDLILNNIVRMCVLVKLVFKSSRYEGPPFSLAYSWRVQWSVEWEQETCNTSFESCVWNLATCGGLS